MEDLGQKCYIHRLERLFLRKKRHICPGSDSMGHGTLQNSSPQDLTFY